MTPLEKLTPRAPTPQQAQSLGHEEVLWREWACTGDKAYARRLFPLVAKRVGGESANWFGLFAGILAAGLCAPLLLTGLPGAWIPLALVGLGVGYWGRRKALKWFVGDGTPRWAWPVWYVLGQLCRPVLDGRPERPQLDDVEQALRVACKTNQAVRHVWERTLKLLDSTGKRPPSVHELVEQLGSSDWAQRLLARHLLTTAGGEAVPLLMAQFDQGSAESRAVASDILHCLARDTRERLEGSLDHLVCPQCLTRFAQHRLVTTQEETEEPDHSTGRFEQAFTRFGTLFKRALMQPSFLSTHYCGCRQCGQSLEFIRLPGKIVAVLDQTMEGEHEQHENTLRVNALQREAPFDLDAVEIVDATDEQVERFCVRIAGDADDHRRQQYGRASCVVSGRVKLSENTKRILRDTFDEVVERRGNG